MWGGREPGRGGGEMEEEERDKGEKGKDLKEEEVETSICHR